MPRPRRKSHLAHRRSAAAESTRRHCRFCGESACTVAVAVAVAIAVAVAVAVAIAAIVIGGPKKIVNALPAATLYTCGTTPGP